MNAPLAQAPSLGPTPRKRFYFDEHPESGFVLHVLAMNGWPAVTDQNRFAVRYQAGLLVSAIGFGIRPLPEQLVLTREDEKELAKWRSAAEPVGVPQLPS